MALTVEDGTGKATSESYISEADADTFFTDRGSPATWTGATSAQKESALRYSAEWLDGRYAWSGKVLLATQALGWPCLEARDEEDRLQASNTVPGRIKNAQCEVALEHLTNALNASQARGGQVRREKVGAVEVEYEAGAPSESAVAHVDRIIRGLGSSRVGIVQLVRS